jgi:hypothetical protein
MPSLASGPTWSGPEYESNLHGLYYLANFSILNSIIIGLAKGILLGQIRITINQNVYVEVISRKMIDMSSRQFVYFIFVLPLLMFVLVMLTMPTQATLKLIVGLVAFLAIPGYLLTLGLRLEFQDSRLGFSLIFGIVIQILNVFFLYVLDTFISFGTFNFDLYLWVITATETLILIILSRPTFSSNYFGGSGKAGFPTISALLALLFALTLVANLFFQGLNTSAVLPDGAAYLDIARSIVSGKFSSLVVNRGTLNPYQDQVGLSGHIGTPFMLSVFFAIGDVTYGVAKIALSLIGALFVYLAYELGKMSFRRIVGLLAASIVAIHPLFRFYSAILYGPEILSAMITVLCIIITARALLNQDLITSILAGITLFLTNLVWQGDTAPIFITIGLIFAFHGIENKVELMQKVVSAVGAIVPFALLLLALRLNSHIELWFLVIGATYGWVFILRAFEERQYWRKIVTVVTVFLALTQFYYFRSYFNPQVYLSVALGASQLLGISFVSDTAQIADRFLRLIWPHLFTYILPIVFVPSILSLPFVSRKSALPYAFLLAWLISRLTLITGQDFLLTDSRFYLSVAIAATVLCSYFLARAYEWGFVGEMRVRKWLENERSFATNFRLNWLIIVNFTIILLLLSSYTPYQAYESVFQSKSAESNGWVPVIDWIKSNTTKSSILLTSGSAGLWAWFTDREVVGDYVIVGQTFEPADQIDAGQFARLINYFRADYVIIDSTVQAYGLILQRLSYLYGKYVGGTIVPLDWQNNGVALEVVISSTSSVNSGVVTLFKVIRGGYNILYRDDVFANWTNVRGTLTIQPGDMTVGTLKNETWGNYAKMAFQQPLTLPPNSLLGLELLARSSSSVTGGVHLQFLDGRQVTQIYGSPGFYTLSLENYAGENLTQVFLYSLLVNYVGAEQVSYGLIQIFWVSAS